MGSAMPLSLGACPKLWELLHACAHSMRNDKFCMVIKLHVRTILWDRPRMFAVANLFVVSSWSMCSCTGCSKG